MRHSSAERADKIDALHRRFHDGEFTETVYRASLFALGLRNDELRAALHEGIMRKPTCESR